MKIKYRNTGFVRQLFLYFRHKYCGLEFSKRYIRYYHLTPEGGMPRYSQLQQLAHITKEELEDLSKTFINDKDYKGYMVKQVIEARLKQL